MSSPRNLRVLLALIAACGALGAGGCARLRPWERGRLAHPTMLLTDQARPGEAHVYAIQEGAIGGASAAEGGCGCN
jgi:Domain of unknown function (DUF4266)